jgi:hypothetical protein
VKRLLVSSLLAVWCPVYAITWGFDHDGDMQGWLAQDAAFLGALGSTYATLGSEVRDGIWRISAPRYQEGRFPVVGLLSPPLGYRSDLFDRVQIRCRVIHPAPIRGVFVVDWTNEHNDWNAPSQNLIEYLFSASLAQTYTSQWQEVTLGDLKSGPVDTGSQQLLWDGELREINLLLVLAEVSGRQLTWKGTPGDIPEAVEIDWIRLTGAAELLQGEILPPAFTEDIPFGRLFAPAVFQPISQRSLAADCDDPALSGALGDLDADGDLDLLAPWTDLATRQHGWLTAVNAGGGQFLHSRKEEVASGGRLAGVDIDRDGRMDVVATAGSYLNTRYLHNEAESGWSVELEIDGRLLAGVGDLEGDGDADVWMGEHLGRADRAQWVYPNQGGRLASEPLLLGSELVAQGFHPGRLVPSPMPDGRTAQRWWSNTGQRLVYWSDALEPVIMALPFSDSYGLYCGDLDLDGDYDQVYADLQGFEQVPLFKGVHLLVNRGNGTADTLAWPQDLDLISQVEFVDLSGDSRPDMVFVDSDVRQPAVVVALGVDEGLPIQEGRYPISGRGGNILTGDVDNDGDLDLVVYERHVAGEGGVHVLLNRLTEGVTAVAAENASPLPVGVVLSPAYPNPFNAATVIPVILPADATHVSLVVYDLLGQPVRKLVDGPLSAGTHLIRWDGTDDRGVALASGVYVYRLPAGGTAAVGRVVLVR